MMWQPQITRISWGRNGAISVYDSNGFVGKMVGRQAAAFSGVISMAFAEAARALKVQSEEMTTATTTDDDEVKITSESPAG